MQCFVFYGRIAFRQLQVKNRIEGELAAKSGGCL
jgi:hypothetical protein